MVFCHIIRMGYTLHFMLFTIRGKRINHILKFRKKYQCRESLIFLINLKIVIIFYFSLI